MKIKIIFVLIIIFRFLDLYTTQLGIINFQLEEQNLLVKFFHLDMQTFFILEINSFLIFLGSRISHLSAKPIKSR